MGKRTFWALAVIFSLLVVGCGTSPPSKLYMLSPMTTPGMPGQSSAKLASKWVGVGPVEMPVYLNRPQLVERIGPEELRLREFHKWAEPLESALPTKLTEDLTTLLGSKGYTFFEWDRFDKADYQLMVKVTRLDGKIGGELVLTAWWALLTAKDHKLLSLDRCRIDKAVKGAEASDLVVAHDEALSELSRRIAGSLERLP